MYALRKYAGVCYLALFRAADMRSAFVLVWASFVFPLRRHLGLSARAFRIVLRENGARLELFVTDGSDIGVLLEVFGKREYAMRLGAEPRCILDLGANVGYASLYFSAHYPRATVYAFEALPATFEKLRRNSALCSAIVPVHAAVSVADGPVSFYDYESSSMSSSLVKRYEHEPSVVVPGIALDSFLREHAISSVDLLKFDIEGSEYDVLASFKGLQRVRALVGEFHEDLSGRTLEEFRALLGDFVLHVQQASPERWIVSGVRSGGPEDRAI